MSDEERRPRWTKTVEITEVVILSVVAIATAWSGYQGTKWGGQQALLYGQASSIRLQADAASTLGGQKLVADASMFTAWLQANEAGDEGLQAALVRRFTPEYRAAFDAWLKIGPLTDPSSPPGPAAMPEYRNPDFVKADGLNAEASAEFAEGTTARETANKYIRDTVLFASVLFLVGIAQRFKVKGARIGANAVAVALLVYTVYSVVALPRI